MGVGSKAPNVALLDLVAGEVLNERIFIPYTELYNNYLCCVNVPYVVPFSNLRFCDSYYLRPVYSATCQCFVFAHCVQLFQLSSTRWVELPLQVYQFEALSAWF